MFTSGSMPVGPKVETKKALLLIDFQNDFVSPNGNLSVPNTSRFLSKLPSLVEKFREQGQIVWTQTIFKQPCSSVSPQTGGYSIVPTALADHLSALHRDKTSNKDATGSEPTGSRRRRLPIVKDDKEAFLSREVPSDERCCIPDSEGIDLDATLVQAIDEMHDIVVKKSTYSALADFGTVVQLRARMIHDLYVCGSLSNIGVHATVQDAVQQGFNVTLIEDCLGFRNDTCHIEAMRRMADDMGADGVDYQELMDDLYGLLGDVIPQSQFTQQFQISSQGRSVPGQFSSLQKVAQWMKSTQNSQEPAQSSRSWQNDRKISSIPEPDNDLVSSAAPRVYDSSTTLQKTDQTTPSTSRKRSTSERAQLDKQDQDLLRSIATENNTEQVNEPEAVAISEATAKKSKTSSAGSGGSSSTTGSPERLRITGQSMSTSHLEPVRKRVDNVPPTNRAMSQPNPSTHGRELKTPRRLKEQRKKKAPSTFLGPRDIIADGDTTIVYDILPPDVARQTFSDLKNNVKWQKMYHRTGEVPRLVAVQGTVDEDGSVPIYRHPADESPPLLRFDAAVDFLRDRCERRIGHRLNHVLIQYYRSGEDNISEHSDKTLDIVRGSKIVNLSLGAMRTMTLRTKRAIEGEPRTAQRIKMPHNSLFVLGEKTNANWLHSVRADKRPEVEKSEEELAFDGERISLTFRHIGTFMNTEEQLIWGQGASGKMQQDAKQILQGTHAENSGEDMIIAFGKENHMNETEFDWDEIYGMGFDVINFTVKAASTEGVEDTGV